MEKVSANLQLSSRLARYAAYVIDGFITGIVNFLITILFSKTDFGSGLSLAWTFGYFWFFTAKYGYTPGKRFFGLRVVKVDPSQKLTVLDGFLREVVGKFISGIIFGFGYLMILVDKERQGLHDKIASTKVLQITPLSGGRKLLAYLLVFVLPLIAIIGIVLAIVLVAINPAKQIQRANELKANIEQQQSLGNTTPTSETQTVSQGNMSIDIPGNWTMYDVPPGVIYSDSTHNFSLAVHVAPTTCYPTLKSYSDDIAVLGAEVGNKEEITINNLRAYHADSTFKENDQIFQIKSYLIKGSKNHYSLALFTPESQSQIANEFATQITQSIKLDEKSVIPSTCR